MTTFIKVVDGKAVQAFSCQQDQASWPDLIEVTDDDPRYLALIAPLELEEVTDPVEKLKAFLIENPDVAAILK